MHGKQVSKKNQTASRAFTQAGGSLTGVQKAQEQEAIVEAAQRPASRLCRPPTYSTWVKWDITSLNALVDSLFYFIENILQVTGREASKTVHDSPFRKRRSGRRPAGQLGGRLR